MSNPLVVLMMGSDSDWQYMSAACDQLTEFGIPYEARVLSAHRTPDETVEFAEQLEGRGVQCVIAAAGGAAHLAGVVAAKTLLPVLGVPIPSTSLQGLDSLLSIVQMPGGIPVGTLAIGKPGAINAAILAAEMIALSKPEVKQKLRDFRARKKEAVLKQVLPPAK
ncbi:MAG TPA: 5-(carboxyamino)imidazole ribonucleotide mutase [Gemmatimonadaceae bacterium]|nr:5-(carboxyamino)imidazole ribonucleotide mutase [Gemmatimonadaceae bacterium]